MHSFIAFNAVAATTTQTSVSTSVQGIDKLSYHIKFSANNTGEFFIEAQNSDTDTWFNLSFNTVMTITADNEAQLIMNEVPFKNLRLKWVPSTGAGTITAILHMKSLGS